MTTFNQVKIETSRQQQIIIMQIKINFYLFLTIIKHFRKFSRPNSSENPEGLTRNTIDCN